MTSGLQRELFFLSLWMLCFWLLGLVFDAISSTLFFGLFIYVVWCIYNLNTLINWLSKPSNKMPESFGLWDDLYYQLYNLQKRNKKSRKKLSRIIKRFRKTTSALPFATIVLDATHKIDWFNPAAANLFGFHPKSDIGQRIDNLIRQPEFIQYIGIKDFSSPLEFKINQKQISLNITPYAKGQYLLSAQDVTHSRKLNEMRRDFISNASHELRTPLTVMSGYVEMLHNKADKNDRYPLEKILQQTDRMEQIILELIELAKIESSSEVDVSKVLDSTEILNEVYSEALSLDQLRHKLEIDIDVITLSGNKDELRTAFSNLLTNAIRYTADGGDIKLFTEIHENTVIVGVQDSGVGISYEHISRLTERFYRVDEGRSRDKGGTGLGLAIVNQILERHGANLLIESIPGKGSVFRCEFPLIK